MELKPLPEWIKLSCQKVEPVGSRVVCSPPPVGTDQDWLCLLHKNIDQSDFLGVLRGQGWQVGGSRTLGSDWFSVRLGEDNLLITKSSTYFDGFMKATAICKEKNLLDKKDRIAVFDEVLGRQEKTSAKKLIFKNLYNASFIFDDPFVGWANVNAQQVNNVVPEPVQLVLNEINHPAPVQQDLLIQDDVVAAGHAFAQQAQVNVPHVNSLLQALMGNAGIAPPPAPVDPDW